MVRRNRWARFASTFTIRYRRALRPVQKLRLVTRLVCWDETLVVMEQSFIFGGGPREGEVAARALLKGGLYDRRLRRFVAIAQLREALGIAAESPARSPGVEAFGYADRKFRDRSTAHDGPLDVTDP